MHLFSLLFVPALSYEELRWWHRELDSIKNSTGAASLNTSEGVLTKEGKDKLASAVNMSMPGIVLLPSNKDPSSDDAKKDPSSDDAKKDPIFDVGRNHVAKKEHTHRDKYTKHDHKTHAQSKTLAENADAGSAPQFRATFTFQTGQCREDVSLKFDLMFIAHDIPANCQELCRQHEECVAFDIDDDDVDESVHCQFYRTTSSNSEHAYIGDGQGGLICFILHASKNELPHHSAMSHAYLRDAGKPTNLLGIMDEPGRSPHEKLVDIASWLSTQKPEDVDALWPDFEHSLRGSMAKQKTLSDTTSKNAKTKLFHTAGVSTTLIVASLASACVILAFYFLFMSRNRDRGVRIPLISMDGFNESHGH